MELALKILLQVIGVGIAFLVNLLDYVYWDKRTRRFKRTLRALFALSATFLLVSVGLIIYDELADNAKQQQLLRELDRVRQPLNDIHVTFRLDVPTQHAALRTFDPAIRDAIHAAVRDASMTQGIYVSQKTSAGDILRLAIPPSAPLFPDTQREPLAHFLLNYPGIELHFYSSGNGNFSDLSKSDLVIPILAVIDRNFSSPQSAENLNTNGTVGIDVTSQLVFSEIYNWRVPQKYWKSNGRIQSLPDLLDATIVIRCRGHARSGQLPVARYLDEIGSSVLLNYATLNIGGRHFQFTRKELTLAVSSDGSQIYIAQISSVRKNGT
jgi:hypothetical protein